MSEPHLYLELPWKVHAKQRPRNAKGHTYTPKPTKDAEAIVKASFQQCMGVSHTPHTGPLSVELFLSNTEFGIDISTHREHENKKLRGDIDNYAKTILDALNGVAWVDDKQIERLVVVKL